jgi:hypothetical protein
VKHWRLSVNEILWAIAWALLVLSLTSLPYLLGCYLSSPEVHFGGFVIAVEDGNSYIAKMGQGARGEWLFHLPYTSETHKGALLFTFYLLLGKLARISGLSLVTTLHLARLVLAPFLLVTIYVFISFFTPWRALRRVSFLLCCFSSGLGWLLIFCGLPSFFGDMPIDFWVPDAFAFLVVLTFPHLCFSQSLLLGIFLLALLAFERDEWRFSLIASFMGLAVSLIHPYTLPLVGTVLGSYILATSKRRGRSVWMQVKHLAIMILPSAPYLVYNLYIFTAWPAFRAWREQSYTLSPHPLHYILGYALVGFLAVPAIMHLWGRKSERGSFLLCWIVVTIIVIYLPLKIQRRLIEGFQIPLCILASLGLARYVLPAVTRSGLTKNLTRFQRYTRPKLRRFVTTAIILLTIPSNLLLIANSLIQVSHLAPPIFHEGMELEAMDWLAVHTQPSDIVFSSYQVGNYIPARAGNRVFLGHGPETIHGQEKENIVKQFFQVQARDAYREEILRRYNVAYLFYGPAERALGDFQPETKPYLEKVFTNGRYKIYEVNLGEVERSVRRVTN